MRKIYLFIILATMIAVNAFGYEKQTWNYETGAKVTKSSDSQRAHALDIYYPETGEGPYPVLIYQGGTAWSSTNYKETAYNEASAFLEIALQRGYAVVCPNNDAISHNPYPGSLHDMKAVVRFLHNNGEGEGISEYPQNIDTSFIAISGCLHGSFMAELIGMSRDMKTEYYEGTVGNFLNNSSSVDAVADFGYAIVMDYNSYPAFIPGCSDCWFYYKTLYAMFSNIAPTIVIHGTSDNIVLEGDALNAYNNYLKPALGDDCEYIQHKGTHQIAGLSNDYYGQVVNFLDRIRAKKATTGIEQISDRQVSGVQKITKDAQILILRGDKTYTLQGQEVR